MLIDGTPLERPAPPLDDLLGAGLETASDEVALVSAEEIVFLEQMPLNPTGKIDRVGLKRMAEDHLHPHGLE
jgi:acyl-coenzyme A synthetase/AMP-(fatty) acid ligase